VAVRVDDATARTIIVRGPAQPRPGMNAAVLRIAPAAYNLGIARGNQGFAAAGNGLALGADSHRADTPDISGFYISDGTRGQASPRLTPRITLDDKDHTGRSPHPLDPNGDQSVGVGGSYAITRNFDVTAGVRYSQDRDRLKPLSDGKADSQAVFVGTQFHF